MNPKTVNDLDPKLKETYERVMGTALAGNPSTPPPTMETQPVEQTAPANPQPQPEPETPAPSSDENSTVSQVFRADESNKSTETATVNPPSNNATTAKKAVNKVLPIIIVGAVAFFAIYAVLWAKLLGLF
ncbi:MAG TPA: hypothetical protein VMR77_00560 [Patescibacteria group bacterium]|jgi:hypothetical protein|nr:hypothetical protein [Patescibacteria group bacterium]